LQVEKTLQKFLRKWRTINNGLWKRRFQIDDVAMFNKRRIQKKKKQHRDERKRTGRDT
jgi:hypothetical protein